MNKIEESNTDRILQAQIILYCDLQPPPKSPAPLLIGLHGYGAHKKQMMREAQLMAPDDFAIASLQGFHQHIKEPKEKGGPLRFGFGWLTNFRSEDSVAVDPRGLLDLIKTLKGVRPAGPAPLILVLVFQTFGVDFRFAFPHFNVLSGVFCICA